MGLGTYTFTSTPNVTNFSPLKDNSLILILYNMLNARLTTLTHDRHYTNPISYLINRITGLILLTDYYAIDYHIN